jgi:hypothetical protein
VRKSLDTTRVLGQRLVALVKFIPRFAVADKAVCSLHVRFLGLRPLPLGLWGVLLDMTFIGGSASYVVSPPVRDLLFCAKHLFVEAMHGAPLFPGRGRTVRRRAVTFDEKRGYVGTALDLKVTVAAARRIEAALTPDDLDVRLCSTAPRGRGATGGG